MVNQRENPPSAGTAKDGRGRRVEDWVRKTIIQTFLAIIREGNTGREASAVAVRARIKNEHPDIKLPSLQSINKILEPVRKGLADDNLNRNWSLSLWMEEPHGIRREDLPLILDIQKKLAVDIPRRSSTGFKINRLTIREARWLAPTQTILKNIDDKHVGDAAHEQTTATKLIEFTRSFALREQAAKLLNEPVDSYDIDLKLSWDEIPRRSFPPREGIHYVQADKQLRLFEEMGIIPVAPATPQAQEVVEMERLIDSQSVGNAESPDPAKIAIDEQNKDLLTLLNRVLNSGYPFRVRFGREDWARSGSDSNNLPSDQDGSNSYEYYVDSKLITPILSLIKFDGEILDSDPRAIRVATAFWAKIKEELGTLTSVEDFEARLKKIEASGLGALGR